MSRVPVGTGRPVTGAITMDPAYSGPSGIVLGRYGCGSAELVRLCVRDLNHAGRTFLSELGEAVVATVPPGERFVFVVERDAFGPSVARKLGIAVGIVQGILTGLNAIEPGHRLDVTSKQWRCIYVARERRAVEALPKGKRRAAWKALACREAGVELADVAEACMMWYYAEQKELGK